MIAVRDKEILIDVVILLCVISVWLVGDLMCIYIRASYRGRQLDLFQFMLSVVIIKCFKQIYSRQYKSCSRVFYVLLVLVCGLLSSG